MLPLYFLCWYCSRLVDDIFPLTSAVSDMEYIEVLTEGIERVLMVRGGGCEVITIYSWCRCRISTLWMSDALSKLLNDIFVHICYVRCFLVICMGHVTVPSSAFIVERCHFVFDVHRRTRNIFVVRCCVLSSTSTQLTRFNSVLFI